MVLSGRARSARLVGWLPLLTVLGSRDSNPVGSQVAGAHMEGPAKRGRSCHAPWAFQVGAGCCRAWSATGLGQRTHRTDAGLGFIGTCPVAGVAVPLDLLLAVHPGAGLPVAAEQLALGVVDLDFGEALAQRGVAPSVNHRCCRQWNSPAASSWPLARIP